MIERAGADRTRVAMIAQASPPPMQFDLPPGTMLGKYEILRKIAMGGMAEIYLSRVRGTAGFEKLSVIKRILPTVANDPTFVRMFLDEARLAATLQHPNIADVYEVDEHAGSPFFAMEFIHGQDVRAIKRIARERKEPVPLAIALAIIHGVASALDYAHDRTGPDGQNLGIVHRDVSSSNILVSYEGAIKLIDFGIARATSRSQQTQVGTLKGKIPYMSPEQCRGQSVDRRSDLWALGVVLYEITVGRRPFMGENDFAVMDQIVHQPLKLPSTVMRNYPPELEAIVVKLLARKVDERYQSAEEVVADLDPFIASNRLWVSAKPLSKYMRTVFTNEVIAWDQAMEDGVTLAAHVASSVTSNSAASELHTPPSSFPAVMPLSQEFSAVKASAIMRAEPTPPPAPLPQAAAVYPDINVKSGGGKKVAFALIGLLALGGGGYVGLTLVQKSKSSASEAKVEMTPTPTPEPAVAKPDDTTKPADVAKPADPPTDTKPVEVAKPTETEPVKPEPTVPENVATAEDPKPVETVETKTDPKDEAVKTTKQTKRLPKQQKQQKQTPKETTPKETTPPKDKKDQPKKDPNQPWDPDSPFLPGQ